MMEIRPFYLMVAAALAVFLQPALAQVQDADKESKEGGAAPAAGQQPPPPQAGVLVVKPQTVVVTENLPARLEASREAVIQPQVSGIVQKRLFEEGSLVRAGQQLYQIDDAVYQANLQSGALKGVDFAVQITLDDGTPYPHKGRMLFADQTVDASTGELLLRAEVPNPDGMLLPGLYVRADIPQSQFHNAYLVPQSAVTRGKTDTLRVVAEDGTFAPREVKIAGSQKNQWIITGGLKPGEMVMVDTLSQLMGSATRITPVILGADGKPQAQPGQAAQPASGKPAASKPAAQ